MLQVFKYEQKDGLTDQLAKDLSVAFYLEPVKVDIVSNESTFNVMAIAAEEFVKQIDLFYFESVLASTGWNKNDDIFDKLEMWNAKATPINKKINYMHNEQDIIGHIITSFAFDLNSKSLGFDSTIDTVPDNFNLCVGGVLYKTWEKPELQERMNNIIKEIAENKWKVSMECLFANFDYGLISPNGEHKIIKRDHNTSFLTKYLRRYGGKGEFEGYKIGRVLRNITFSGKGLVTNPANLASVIIKTENKEFLGTAASADILPSETRMTDTTYTKEQYDELVKRLEKAEASLKEVAEKTVNKEIDSLKLNLKDLETSKAKVESDLAVSKETIKAHEAKVATLNDELTKAKEDLAKANEKILKSEKETLKAKRLAMFNDVKVEPTKAQELVDKFVDASDDIFDELVKAMPKKDKEDKKEDAAAALANAKMEADVNNVPGSSANKSHASAWFSSLSSVTQKQGE